MGAVLLHDEFNAGPASLEPFGHSPVRQVGARRQTHGNHGSADDFGGSRCAVPKGRVLVSAVSGRNRWQYRCSGGQEKAKKKLRRRYGESGREKEIEKKKRLLGAMSSRRAAAFATQEATNSAKSTAHPLSVPPQTAPLPPPTPHDRGLELCLQRRLLDADVAGEVDVR